MLKRSWPRSRTSRVSRQRELVGTAASVDLRRCRAALILVAGGRARPCPATSGRADRRREEGAALERLVLRLVVHVLPAAGRGRGERALRAQRRCSGACACRQLRCRPSVDLATTSARAACASRKPPRRLGVELRVGRLDAEEEAVAAGQREARHVENRMVRHRQPVQRQHPEHGGERGDEDRHSNVIGMNAGQLLNGRPPTLSG